jgi:hypothetical protein
MCVHVCVYSCLDVLPFLLAYLSQLSMKLVQLNTEMNVLGQFDGLVTDVNDLMSLHLDVNDVMSPHL